MMKKIKYFRNLMVFGLSVIAFSFVTSCDDDVNPFLDLNNPENSLGVFSPANELTYNPVENVQNEIMVGVTTLSDVDRPFVLSLDEASTTLEDNFYEIESLTGVIPAGSLLGSVVITTFGADNLVLPNANRVIALQLESIEGAVLETGTTAETLALTIACPTALTQADLLGTWAVTVDAFGVTLGDGTFEIVAGPGANQVTALDIFNHPNPSTGGVYDVVMDVDFENATINILRQDAWHCDNLGCSFGQGRINGSGDAFNCIGNGNLKFNFQYTVDAGSFGTFAMEMSKL